MNQDLTGRAVKVGDTVRARLFARDAGTNDFLVTEKDGTLQVNGYPISLYDEVTVLA
jgi:hypothetical protein